MATAIAKTQTTDDKAPMFLEITISDADGNVWGKTIASGKVFSSGSCGFYGNDKLTNPLNGARYQFGAPITLIGSKPK